MSIYIYIYMYIRRRCCQAPIVVVIRISVAVVVMYIMDGAVVVRTVLPRNARPLRPPQREPFKGALLCILGAV